MQPLKNFLKLQRPARIQSERGELLEYFLDAVNTGRKGTKYKLVTIKRIAFMLTGVPTKDLYALKSKMEDGERRGYAASAIFFLELKAK